jgi:hypothetical protein
MTFDFASLANSPLEHLRGAGAVSVILASFAAMIGNFNSREAVPRGHQGNSAVTGVPPIEAPPLLLRNIDPVDALSINRKIPFSRDANPAARPFKIKSDEPSYERALACLAQAIYYEASNEPIDGQRAVAQVVLNRVRHPAFVPSVCGVVYHGSTRVTGCQFSFTCDGSLRRLPSLSGWKQVRAIAARALAGSVFRPVGYATHYHADYVVPYWATSLAKNAVIGRHIFYRWPQWWGTPGAFARRHAGSEPNPRLLRDLALRRAAERAITEKDLAVGTDPRVELMSIIQFLAVGSAAGEPSSGYEEQVRKHFYPHSGHLAVLIYRQLSEGAGGFNAELFLDTVMQASQPAQGEGGGPLPARLAKALGGPEKATGFIAALRDFVKVSDFEQFYKDRQPFYAELTAEARKPALALVQNVARDSDIPVHTARFVLAPLRPSARDITCYPVPNADRQAWLILGARDGLDKAVQSKKASDNLSRSDCVKLLARRG